MVTCLQNIRSLMYFVLLESDLPEDKVRVIRPNDGQIVILERGLFQENEFEIDENELTKSQINKLNQYIDAMECNTEIEPFPLNVDVRASYTCARFTFSKNCIDPLGDDDRFAIVCRDGTFVMSKADFNLVFSNVSESNSYLIGGSFNYKLTPRKAYQFKV